jgi:hypothetical protein
MCFLTTNYVPYLKNTVSFFCSGSLNTLIDILSGQKSNNQGVNYLDAVRFRCLLMSRQIAVN